MSERPSVQRFLSLIPPGLQSECLFALLGANFKLSAFSKLADRNHTILAALFPRLEAPNASPAHPWKPHLAWLFLYRGANLKLSAFRIGRDRKTRAFLKQKADRFPTNHVRSSEVTNSKWGRHIPTPPASIINLNLDDEQVIPSTQISAFCRAGEPRFQRQ